ncbi:GGDEF domain-containing protein [Demequina sp. NBRC 110055]|uniref:GGDEF domain-containing protein n=1 Tax=Demequina sp. NBRC 110055 TaxID=1570344 RepID=UPI00135647D9|nr:diguanylate cyclase [Demequina sp. NBRC 110055]
MVVSLAAFCVLSSIFYAGFFLWWRPEKWEFFVALGALSIPVFIGALVAAVRGSVVGAAVTFLATTLVCLVPFAVVFSVSSGVQFLFLAVGFLTLAALPDRLVVVRLVFCGVVIVAIAATEIVAPPGSSAIADTDPAFAAMAIGMRLGGIALVLTAITMILLRTARLEQQLVQLAAQGERRANTDELTGIGNRRPAMRELEMVASDPSRHAALALIDIDLFKTTNDTWGHEIGDAVISAVATRIEASMGRQCVVSRWGGDEFLAISRPGHVTIESSVQKLMQSLREEPIEVGDATIEVTLSVGIAVRHPGTPVSETLAAADEALYRAKSEGRDRVRVAPPRPEHGATVHRTPRSTSGTAGSA